MNQKIYLLPLVILFGLQNSIAQDTDYFQQTVNYKIDVRLNDDNHFLHGQIEMEYTNNSPDALKFIYFHLWPNAYKNNQTALAKQQVSWGRRSGSLNNSEAQGYIDSLDFRVNEQTARLQPDSIHIDIGKLLLPKALKSGETIIIKTPFRVKIPRATISRFGHLGKAYKITQWYPKPAVYDREGWHPMPYLDMGEFYYEYGNFEVNITLPAEYVVAATGNLHNQDEEKRLHKLAQQTEAMIEKRNTTTPDAFRTHGKQMKTLRYTEKDIHDFAWFADKDYLVLRDSVKLPHSGRKVISQAFFRKSNIKHWKKAPGYINDALYYYSKWYGDYPYDYCSAILNPPGSRGGGMEYPTITAIGNSPNDLMLEIVIMHEVGHNWFYGMLGFNEREHPWLDEGINTFSEIRYMEAKYGDTNMVAQALNPFAAKALGIYDFPYRALHKYQYLNVARKNIDQPATLHSVDLDPWNYGSVIYSKTGLSFRMLMDYLGEAEFNHIMRDFAQKWRFKHPGPKDIEKAFRDQASKDVDWFFNIAIGSTKQSDYKIKKIKGNALLVKNKTGTIIPFKVSGIKQKEEIYTHWQKGFAGEKWIDLPEEPVDRIAIDYRHTTLDKNETNNQIKTHGLFKKVEPLALHPMGPVEQPDRTSINFLPVAGYNYYNTGMVGLYLHSAYFPFKNLTYHLAPLYGIKNQDLAGEGAITYSIHPKKGPFRKIDFNMNGKRYAYNRKPGESFNRGQLKTNLWLRRLGPTKSIYQRIKTAATVATDITEIITAGNPGNKSFGWLQYDYRNYEWSNPLRSSIMLEGSDDFLRTTLQLKYDLHIDKQRKNSIDFRFFAGAFLTADDIAAPYYFHTSGATGVQDYTYESTFIGRFESPQNDQSQQLLSQQFVYNQGGFAAFSPFGLTDDWIASLNVYAPIPFLSSHLPIKAYGNLATYGKTLDVTGYNTPDILLETGIRLSLNGVINIYFPAFMSHAMEKYNNKITDNYAQRIRFTMNLNRLIPNI